MFTGDILSVIMSIHVWYYKKFLCLTYYCNLSFYVACEGMSYCQYNGREYGASLKKSGVEYLLEDSIMNVDYILLQSAKSLPHYELTPSETVRKTKKYLFDAGTSRFDSSLFWLTCAFSQVL